MTRAEGLAIEAGGPKAPRAGTPGQANGPRDEALAARAAAGDRAAFDALVARYGARVHGLALRTLGRPADAEDLAQEVFLKAYRHLHRYDPERPFAPWLYRLAANLALSRARSLLARRRRERSLAALGEGPIAPLEAAEQALRRRELGARPDAATLALPPRYRVAFNMKYVLGMEASDVAAHFGVGLATAKTWLYRARECLRRRLGDELP